MTTQTDHIVPVKVMIRLDPLADPLNERRCVCGVAEDGTLSDLRLALVRGKVIDDYRSAFVFDGRIVSKESESRLKWCSLVKNEEIVICRISTSPFRKNKLSKGLIISGDDGPQSAGHAVVADDDFIVAHQLTPPGSLLLQPHPELKVAIKEILEEQDVTRRSQKLDMVREHCEVDSAEMGRMCYATRVLDASQKSFPLQSPLEHQQPDMTMSPRHSPSNMYTPGTSTVISPVDTALMSTLSPRIHTRNFGNVTSPLSIPTLSTGSGLASRILNPNAKPFVPGLKTTVTLKNLSGQEIHTPSKECGYGASRFSRFWSPSSVAAVRMESEDAKAHRLAEERRRKEKEEAEKAKEAERQPNTKYLSNNLAMEQFDSIASPETSADPKAQTRANFPDLRPVVSVNITVRPRNPPDALAAKQGERRLVCCAAEEATLTDIRAMLVQDKIINIDDKPVFILDGRAIDESSESAKKWRSVFRDGKVLISRMLTLPSLAREDPTASLSPLAAAQIIYDLDHIDYPEGIKGPEAGLNVNADRVKFRYDREFLLQFMDVCKDRPDNLPPLESIGIWRNSNESNISSRNRRNNYISSRASSTLPSCASRIRPANSVALFEISTTRTYGVDMSTRQIMDPAKAAEQEVDALLNNLTEERFDSISDQIIAWANKSESEIDAHTLIQVIRLVFEKMAHGNTSPELCARLCRKMEMSINPKMQGYGPKYLVDGRRILRGNDLFRRHLLNHICGNQQNLASKKAIAGGVESAAGKDQVIHVAVKAHDDVQKANILDQCVLRFVVELFKQRIITEHEMHKYMHKLLGHLKTPEEKMAKNVCEFLHTRTPKGHAHLDMHVSHMKELAKSPHLDSCILAILQEVIALHDPEHSQWLPGDQIVDRTAAVVVRKTPDRNLKVLQERQQYQYALCADRGEYAEASLNGQAAAGSSATRAPSKADDLTDLGKIPKNSSMACGSSSVFKTAGTSMEIESTAARIHSVTSALRQDPTLADDAH